ncbi:MAG: putative hydrolase of the HAD [Geobacteraceae bacterium]|nr:MAG: putative hydrolase of the HAD [Geobacteraceae bacterium]
MTNGICSGEGAMKNLPKRCSVFLTPSGNDFTYAEALIQELSSKFEAPPFEPHVTVYSGMFTDLDALERVVAAAVEGMEPFPLVVSGIGWSEEFFKTLFIEFEENETLRVIFERIKAGGEDSGYQLVPHLSLMYKDMPLREKEALARRIVLDRSVICFDEVKVVAPQNLHEGWRDTGMWETVVSVKLREKGRKTPVRTALFDFGGVLAEEGFREGLHAIARRQRLDPLEVHRIGMDAVYDSGYVLGRGSEADFWALMRKLAGIKGVDEELSREVLSRFILRPRMLELVRALRKQGVICAILSDQTDWLERLDTRDHFFREFDRVFNSYCLGKGKRDATVFDDVVHTLNVLPCEALFVDDMPSNVERAGSRGLQALLFEDEGRFIVELEKGFCFTRTCDSLISGPTHIRTDRSHRCPHLP